MLLDLGILLASYVSVRVFEKYRDTRKGPSTALVNPLPPTPLVESQTEDPTAVAIRKQEHYVKLSTLNIGIATVRQFIYPQAALLNIALYTYLTIPTFRRAEEALLERNQVNGYVLDVLSISLTPLIGQYFAGSVGAWLHHQGRKITIKTQDHSLKVIAHAFEQQPRQVWRIQDGVEMEVPLASIQVNDIVVVNACEVVPVDGCITEGAAMIDQHALTGESQLAEKMVGDEVFASTAVVNGRILVRVKHTGQDTTIAKIGQILTHSTQFKTHFQTKSEDWADKAAVPLLVSSVLVSPVLGVVGTIGVLYCNISGPLRLTGSLGTLNHISLASYQGILIKDGRAIEFLKQVDTVIFDKTGTLTTEQPAVGQVITCSNYPAEEILKYAAAAECKLNHPVAKAIVKQAMAMNLILPEIEDSKYQMGFGVSVQVDHLVIKVGSSRFMKQEDIPLPDSIKQAQTDAHREGHSLVLVAINDQVSGAIEIQATVRPEVKTVIDYLRHRGIQQIAIVSGDHRQPTKKLAKSLGIANYFYDVLPKDKAEIVEQLQQEGRTVCFIGDGINDAIALRKANISISLRGASTVATDMAQVVLMDGSLSHLPELFELADSLEANLKKTLFTLMVPGVLNLSGMFLFHLGLLGVIVISNTGVALGIVNAMSPLKKLQIEPNQLTVEPHLTVESQPKETENKHLQLSS